MDAKIYSSDFNVADIHVVDHLVNHAWNMQATIFYDGARDRICTQIDTVKGRAPWNGRDCRYYGKPDSASLFVAYAHVLAVLGMREDTPDQHVQDRADIALENLAAIRPAN